MRACPGHVIAPQIVHQQAAARSGISSGLAVSIGTGSITTQPTTTSTPTAAAAAATTAGRGDGSAAAVSASTVREGGTAAGVTAAAATPQACAAQIVELRYAMRQLQACAGQLAALMGVETAVDTSATRAAFGMLKQSGAVDAYSTPNPARSIAGDRGNTAHSVHQQQQHSLKPWGSAARRGSASRGGGEGGGGGGGWSHILSELYDACLAATVPLQLCVYAAAAGAVGGDSRGNRGSDADECDSPQQLAGAQLPLQVRHCMYLLPMLECVNSDQQLRKSVSMF